MGDTNQLSISWLDDEEHRCFDILAVYYGSDRAFACPQCIAVFQERAVKWQALHRLYLSDLWSKVKDKYKAFMLPDDDLIMSTHVINTAFWTVSGLDLDLAQVSVCRHRDSGSAQRMPSRVEGLGLRYTSFVEVMAPIASRRVMNEIIMPNLADSYYGWGLDIVWPRLLGYPHDKIAIIDEVCMFHPRFQHPRRKRIYSIKHPKGWNSRTEMAEIRARFNASEEDLRALNMTQHDVLYSSLPLEEFQALRGRVPQCPLGQHPAGLMAGDHTPCERSGSLSVQVLAVGQLIIVIAIAIAFRLRQTPRLDGTRSPRTMMP